MKRILADYTNGPLTVFYLQDPDAEPDKTGTVGLTILPTGLKELFTPEGHYRVESLVQLKFTGDAYPGDYSMGVTMRNSESSWKLKFVSQEQLPLPGNRGSEILTVLRSDRAEVLHRLTLKTGEPWASVETEVRNITDRSQTLEMISSFSLCDLSPIGEEERMADLNFCRLRSRWAQEGKLLKESLTDLHMEPCWTLQSCRSERYGQVGSLPVRGWFPWGVLEDTRYGFLTGAVLYHPGSWQMELYERDDKAAFSGGLADREFGQFTKTLGPGESFRPPKAVIASVQGDIDDISFALTKAQEETIGNVPDSEKDLPVLFNEYCTTWGDPSYENIKQIVEKIRGKGFRYFVIDSGWYRLSADNPWYLDQGDWIVNETIFPGGFGDTVKLIRDAGMIPGLWFELETLSVNSKAYRELEALELMMDGEPLSECGKRYLDMKKPETVAYLTERVTGLLKKNGFGYIKVDYNGTFGVGPDGPESRGEENRKSVLASRAFFEKMRGEIPELVIENCASGGHRQEPSMMAVCSMSSFSDAHEAVVIPVVAANLHRAILPRQSQIWAVMRKTDSERRIVYSIAAGLLGRLCLSGDVAELSEEQWALIDRGLSFYREAVPVIRTGRSVLERDERMDYAHLKGTQIVKRFGRDDAERSLLIVIHRFEDSGRLTITLPAGYVIVQSFKESCVNIKAADGLLSLEGLGPWSACGLLMEKL